jgi:hypothetical protein
VAWHVTADVGFLSDKAAVLGVVIKERHIYICQY